MSVFQILFAARRQRIRVWIFLADLYWLRFTLMSSILVAGTGGVHPLLTNSVPEALRYGLPNPIGPLFWTLPHLESQDYDPDQWGSKLHQVIGSRSGDPRRKVWIEEILPIFQGEGFSFRWSDSRKLSYTDYILELRRSKIAIVPTLLQEEFQKGPPSYKKRLSKTIVTGRVLETFSVGTALLTNFNQNLEDWGFRAGLHYMVLPETADEMREWRLPPDDDLQQLARRAYLHWKHLVKNQKSLLSN